MRRTRGYTSRQELALSVLLGLSLGACGRVGYDTIAEDESDGSGSMGDPAATAGGDSTAGDAAPGSGSAATTGGSGSDAAVPDAGFVPTIDGSPVAQGSASVYRRSVVVDTGAVAADMPDFPLLVRLAADSAFSASVAFADGRDIRFVANDGSVLDYEIELFDPATGELVAWVRVPLLSATSPNEMYLEYGDPNAVDEQNPPGVWESRYVSVWHLAQSPGAGGADEIVDSTGTSPGTAHDSMDNGDVVVGQIGPAIDFDGVDDEITFVNTFTGTGPHTISAWVNQRPTTDVDAIVVFGSDTLNRARWFYSSFGPNDRVSVGFYTNDFISTIDVLDAGFTHLVWTYDGSTSRLYVNGSLADSAPHSSADTAGSSGWIGNVFVPGPRGFGTDQHLDGQLDEIRVFADVLDADRVRAEYENQAATGTFVTVGDPMQQ